MSNFPPTSVRFVVQNDKGQYWSKYQMWTNDVGDAYLFFGVGSAKRSMAYQTFDKRDIRVLKVEISLTVLDTAYEWV